MSPRRGAGLDRLVAHLEDNDENLLRNGNKNTHYAHTRAERGYKRIAISKMLFIRCYKHKA